MFDLKMLPSRQKWSFSCSILAGLFLILCFVFDGLRQDSLNQLILVYSIGIPLFILTSENIIDLNNPKVFILWMLLAILMVLVTLFTNNNPKFLITRSKTFDADHGVNSLLALYSTSSLKSLMFFLIVYWPLNKILNQMGLFMINTFHQKKWYHPRAQRKITWLDVLFNLFLLLVIIAAALFG